MKKSCVFPVTSKVFIASPLFNPRQIEVIERIETLLESVGIPYYSARQHAPKLIDIDNPIQRAQTFQSNVQGLAEATHMIAVLDWLLENGAPSGISDNGTVWEMGSFYFQNKPVIGFYVFPPKKPNLMLANSCSGFCYGFEELERFVLSPQRDDWTGLLMEYVGEVQ